MSRVMTTGQMIWIQLPSVRPSLLIRLTPIVDLSGTPDFRGKFSAIQRTYSPVPRKFYGYCTSITVRFIYRPPHKTLFVNRGYCRRLRQRLASLQAVRLNRTPHNWTSC
jgi:hypothetical protein